MSRMNITLDINELVEKNQAEQRKLRDKADELVAKVETENREYTKDEESELKELQDKIVAIGKRNELLKRQATVGADLDKPGESRTKKTKTGPVDRLVKGDDDETEQEEREKRYARAFDQYIRRGFDRMDQESREALQRGYSALPEDSEEVRDLSAITGVAGGYTVPAGFVADVERAMKDYSGVMQSRAQVIPTSTGADLPWPTINDTSNEGEQVDENTATSTDNLTFGQITAKAYLFSSKLVLLPIQLLQDTAINMTSLLTDLFAERLGRIKSRRLTTGTGSNQPQGVVTASVLGVTAAGSSAITYDETIDLEHSIDPAYRAQAEYMFHDDCHKLLRKLKDSDGRPIWMPAANAGMANGAPGLLNNSPYRINQHMASPGSGNKSMLYGDFSKYKIRSVQGMIVVRLNERYAEKFQVGFMAFQRMDGRLSNAGTNPIKHLVHP